MHIQTCRVRICRAMACRVAMARSETVQARSRQKWRWERRVRRKVCVCSRGERPSWINGRYCTHTHTHTHTQTQTYMYNRHIHNTYGKQCIHTFNMDTLTDPQTIKPPIKPHARKCTYTQSCADLTVYPFGKQLHHDVYTTSTTTTKSLSSS